MRSTFEDLAGDIGSKLSDALISAFRNNDLTSAINSFEDDVTGMIENIIAQMIFATYFQDMFDTLQQGMEDSFKGENPDYDIVDNILEFLENYTSGIPEYMKALEDTQEVFKNYGLDLFQMDASRTVSAKGIAQASQDSVDELNGRMTAVQQFTYELRNNSTESLAIDREVLTHQRVIRNQLDTIAENSGHLKDLPEIKQTLDEIKLKGIKVKT